MTNVSRREAAACSGATAMQAAQIADACTRKLTHSETVSPGENLRPPGPWDAAKSKVQQFRGFRTQYPCAGQGRIFRRGDAALNLHRSQQPQRCVPPDKAHCFRNC